ncbi:hypothetical protein LguiB_030789 [Lonicera macranthoides]
MGSKTSEPPKRPRTYPFELHFLLPSEYSITRRASHPSLQGNRRPRRHIVLGGVRSDTICNDPIPPQYDIAALDSVQPGLSPGTSTLTALFLGAHDQLPRGSPILGLLWPKHA